MAQNKAFSGVYTILNLVTMKIYIGSAVNFIQRRHDHLKSLRAGKHKNAFLQAAWNKYGSHSFAFSLICECEPAALIAVEQQEIDIRIQTNGWASLYNINPVAGSRLGATLSAESRARIGNVMRGKPGRHTGHRHTEATKALLRNRPVSVETKRKMSIAKRGRTRKPFTDETRMRMAESARMRAYVIPLERRMAMSRERTGVPWSATRRSVYINNKQREIMS